MARCRYFKSWTAAPMVLIAAMVVGELSTSISGKVFHSKVGIVNKMQERQLTAHCFDFVGNKDLGFSVVTGTVSFDVAIDWPSSIPSDGVFFACDFYAPRFITTHVILLNYLDYCTHCIWTATPSGFFNVNGNLRATWNSTSVAFSPI